MAFETDCTHMYMHVWRLFIVCCRLQKVTNWNLCDYVEYLHDTNEYLRHKFDICIYNKTERRYFKTSLIFKTKPSFNLQWHLYEEIGFVRFSAWVSVDKPITHSQGCWYDSRQTMIYLLLFWLRSSDDASLHLHPQKPLNKSQIYEELLMRDTFVWHFLSFPGERRWCGTHCWRFHCPQIKRVNILNNSIHQD